MPSRIKNTLAKRMTIPMQEEKTIENKAAEKWGTADTL